MSIQDRTYEFQQCVRNYDKINRRHATQLPPVPKSHFSRQAALIMKDISHVTELLSKLALLAKRKPLFDDKPVEISELTYVIKQDIFKIEQNIQRLQSTMRGDSAIQHDSQAAMFSKNVVNLLNNNMKNVSGEFKVVLETRQKNEMLNKSRQENFLSATSTVNSTRTQSPMDKAAKAASDNPYMTYDDPPDEVLSIPNQQQQLLLMEEQQGAYLQQRSQAVESIESTINEVGNLFQQLATMVSEQGEQIQRIDENVEDINLNIHGAQRELLKYYNHISNNRWLFLKIFGVLILFFLIWVLVG
ncbi:integral membrane protein Sed5p [Diutina catenulata]